MDPKTNSKRYLSVIFFITFLLSINAQINKPFIQVPSIQGAPVIDGNLKEASWQKAAKLSGFVNWTRNSYIKDPVTVLLYFDAKNLYVAFRNDDPMADSLNRKIEKDPRDAFLWGRDHAMVSLRYKENSIRMMADPKGTMTDWKNSDINWNGEWKYGASINRTDWSCEFSIPLSELNLTDPATAGDIELSLSRSFPGGQSSSWSGGIRLAQTMTIACETGKWPEPVPGVNNIKLTASNNGKEPVDILCTLELIPLKEKPLFINQAGQGPSSELQLGVRSQPLVFKFNYSVPAGGTINKEMTFNLPVEGSYYASAAISSKSGTLLRQNTDFWFTIEPSRERLNDVEKMAGESIAAMTRLAPGTSDKLKAEADRLYEDIQKLKKDSQIAWKSDKWNEFTKDVAQKEQEASRLLHRIRWSSLRNWKDEGDFGVALAHSVLKLRKDVLFPLPINDRIEISLAGNEYESFQLAILPFGKDLKNLQVQVSDLTGQGGVIPGNRIEVALVDYNWIDWQADYVTEYKGWHPDPLIPLKSGMNISGNDLCRPLWITVYAPAGTKAGEYEGSVSVIADGMKAVTASLKCRVWGFDLPIESKLKTHSWDEQEFLAGFYNLEKLPVDWYLRFCDLLLKHRLNPAFAGVDYMSETPASSGKYDFRETEKVLEFCISRGLSRFTIIQMRKGQYSTDEAEKVYDYVEAYAKFLKSKGWLDKALVELWDEPTDLEWPYIKERAERLKKIEPDLPLQLFAEGGPYDFFDRSTDKYGLNDLVDIWAPVNIIESPETQAKGKEIWTYFCTLARESAPNFFIDCPAIYQRSISWYCWMFGVDGFEHWSTTYFWRNVHKGLPMDQKWPNVPWDSRSIHYFNGEGHLIYPGPEGNFYSSLRLENFRDGMEDYEYLVRLKDLLDKYDGNSSDPALEEFRQLLKPENYLLYKYPRKIKVTLENTLRYPDQPELFSELKVKLGEAIEKLQEGH